MNFRIGPVGFSNINFENPTFQITTDRDPSPLKRSVQGIGLITPPVLFDSGTDLVIISGFRRIQVCRNLGWLKTEFRILPTKTEPLRLAQIAIAENSFQRELNLIELSRAYNLLHEMQKNAAALQRTAEALNLPGTPAFIKKIRPLSQLAETIQQGILSETVPLPMALELAEMETEEGIRLAEFFTALYPSLNKQREMLGMAKEIAAREDLSIWDVFQSPPVQEVLSNEDLDRNQKIFRLRRHLKHRRFPALSRAEDHFQEVVKTLKLGAGVQLNPPPFFEGSDYRLSLCFSRLSELEAGKEAIDRILQSPEFRHFIT
jgi:ParB family transcriptional regulator, chromosome partitioning protein